MSLSFPRDLVAPGCPVRNVGGSGLSLSSAAACRWRRSSVAQLAEHPTVNRTVTGSSPVGGAKGQVRGHVIDHRALAAGLMPHKSHTKPESLPSATRAGWYGQPGMAY